MVRVSVGIGWGILPSPIYMYSLQIAKTKINKKTNLISAKSIV